MILKVGDLTSPSPTTAPDNLSPHLRAVHSEQVCSHLYITSISSLRMNEACRHSVTQSFEVIVL